MNFDNELTKLLRNINNNKIVIEKCLTYEDIPTGGGCFERRMVKSYQLRIR